MRLGIYVSNYTCKIIEIVAQSAYLTQWSDDTILQYWMTTHNAEQNIEGYTYIGEV